MDIYASKLSSAMDIGVGVYLLILAVLSAVGNVLVLIVAFRRSHSMKPPELLSVNLALTDLGAAITMYPLSMVSAWNHHWLGGNATCIYYGLAGFFFGTASIMTLTVMALVRFWVSLSLESPKQKISWRTIKLLCMWCWVWALVWCLLPLLGWGKYGPEPFGLSCTLAWAEMKDQGFSFVISMFTFNLLLPSMVIVFGYFGVAVRLYLTYKSINNSNQIPNVVKMNRRLMLIAVLLSLGFIGSWTPYGIVSLWSIFQDDTSIPPALSMLPCMFAKASTVYNPLVYYAFSKTFKHEVKQLCLLCKRRPNSCHVSSEGNNSIYTYDRNMDKVPNNEVVFKFRPIRETETQLNSTANSNQP